jgi:hypothetical protein
MRIMDNALVVTILANKLGELAQKLFQLGHDYRIAKRPVDAKVMNELSSSIWATLTQCEAVYDDITYEDDKKNIGFMK